MVDVQPVKRCIWEKIPPLFFLDYQRKFTPRAESPEGGTRPARRRLFLGLLLGAASLAPINLRAVEVEGTILDADSRRPLAHASVAASGRGATVIADARGRFEMELPPGNYWIEVRRIGYRTRTRQVELLEGQRVRLNFSLQVLPLDQAATLVTATGQPKSAAELTVPVAEVPREAIDLSGAENVAELLQDVAGINVHSALYNHLGSPSGVMIQGIDPRRVLILVDGERVIGGAGGVIDLAQLPVCQVERVEVVQGPHSALYGSDAMGGVVHILTRSPQKERGGDFRFSLGSGGMTALEGQAVLAGSGLSASLIASRTVLEALDRSPQDPDTDLDAYTNRFTQGQLRWQARPSLSLLASGRWLSEEEEGVFSRYFPPLDKTYVWHFPDHVQRVELGTRAEWQSAEGSSVSAHVSRTWFEKNSREELMGGREARERSTANVLTRYHLRAVKLLRHRHLLTGGLEHSREELEVALEHTLPRGEQRRSVEVPRSRVEFTEAYVQDDWQVGENTGVVGGARYQWHSRFGSHLTPKISLSHRLSPRLKVRASYGEGYRAPSLKELHFVFDHSNLGYKVLGTPTLRPERSRGLNLGAEFEPVEELGLRLNFFHNRLRNLIQTVFDSEQSSGPVAIYAYDNVGRASTRGIGLGMSSRIGDRLSINAGYTFLRARDRDARSDLPGRPRHALRVRSTWATPAKGRLELKLRRDSSVWSDAEATLRSPAAAEWDVNTEKPLRGLISLKLGIENLFDIRRDPERPGDLRSPRGRILRGGLLVQL